MKYKVTMVPNPPACPVVSFALLLGVEDRVAALVGNNNEIK